MNKNKKVVRMMAGLIFQLFLTALASAVGLAAPAEKLGLDWGPDVALNGY